MATAKTSTKPKAPAKKGAAKKAAPAKKAPAKAARATAHPPSLAPSDIKVIKGFNPRTDLGDLEGLTNSIKANKILQPLLVRPGAKAGYELICGHKRLAAATELGFNEVPVLVRTDLTDDAKALAAAMAENSADSRTALNAIDEAKGFKVLMETHGWTPNKVGKSVGCSGQKVRNSLKILDTPTSVQKKVSEGTLSASAATEIGRLETDIQKRVLEEVDEDMTAKDVKRLANEAVREAKDSGDDAASASASAKGKKGKGQDAGTLAVWQSKGEVRAKMEELVEDIVQAQESGGDQSGSEWALAALMWSAGSIDDIDPGTKQYKKAYKDLYNSIEWETDADEDEDPGDLD